MSRNIVIDHDILGWAEKSRDQLSLEYSKIYRVGIGYDLPQRTADDKVAAFCKEYDCDLLTADTTAYMHFFEAGITSVQITKYAEEVKSDKNILLIRIV